MDLPKGLVYHCDACKIVVPEDSPCPEGGDCAVIADVRIAIFNPYATLKAQHTMASAAWQMIYHQAIADKEAASAEYLHRFHHAPRDHFQDSALHKALTPEEIEQQKQHPQDVWAYATD